MKKSIKIKEHLTNTDIYVCYGNDEYQKVAKALKLEVEPLDSNGMAHEFLFVEGGGLCCYFVGINDNRTKVETQTTLVHELSHIISYLMKYFGFIDDEFRSYLLAYLYEKCIIWLDKIPENKQALI